MKTTLILLAVLALTTTSATAKSIEITVKNIRNNEGSILVMAQVEGAEQPFYGKAEAKKGEAKVTLKDIDATTANISVFHDENGDYKMKMGERGPEEGYATKNCKLTAEKTEVTLKLYYPGTENF